MDKIPGNYAFRHITMALPTSLRSAYIASKIYNKLDQNNHLNYDPIIQDLFFHQYVKYYIDGLIDEKDFDDIVSDAAFHFTEFNQSKHFFLEVYLDNKFLQRKFKNIYHVEAIKDISKFKSWMVENFTKYYQKYHKDDIL